MANHTIFNWGPMVYGYLTAQIIFTVLYMIMLLK